MAEQYVRLVLAVGQHDPAYVDAYYGPAQWQEEAQRKNSGLDKIKMAAKLVRSLVAMAKPEDAAEKGRLKYLATQLTSLLARVEMLGGKRLSFDAQSRALYDTEAPHTSLEVFSKVLTELDQLLPGEGSLIYRSERFKKQFEIPRDKLAAVFDAAITACRDRTKEYVKLLDNENFTLEYVTNKSWSGYNWYKGDAFSLIQVNTEFPIHISRAVDLGCHEGYPGHHTYNALLEANLVKQRGWVEFSVYPLFSPQSLIAEGSANYGIELAFPGDEKLAFEKNVLYPLAGLDPATAETYEKFQRLTRKLSYVGNELARLYLNSEIDETQAIAMIQQYTLANSKKAAQRLKFWQTYGAYVINYNWGKDLVRQWVESGGETSVAERWKRFSQLLSSPRLPSDLTP